MEIKDYLSLEFEGLERNMKRVLKNLTQDELRWRPACGCNSIGLILFHILRSEDSFVNPRLQDKPEVWDEGKWYQKLNLPQKEAGAHYTVEQVNDFLVPELDNMMAYHDAVRTSTREYLKILTPADFDKKITMIHFGEITVAALFSLIVGHASGHIGEISYLRGLQRGMDK